MYRLDHFHFGISNSFYRTCIASQFVYHNSCPVIGKTGGLVKIKVMGKGGTGNLQLLLSCLCKKQSVKLSKLLPNSLHGSGPICYQCLHGRHLLNGDGSQHTALLWHGFHQLLQIGQPQFKTLLQEYFPKHHAQSANGIGSFLTERPDNMGPTINSFKFPLHQGRFFHITKPQM